MPPSTRLYMGGQGSGAAQNRRVAINVQGANNASVPVLQSFTSTSETAFLDQATGGTASTLPLAVVVPPGGPCEQEVFTITMSGYVKTGQSSTIVLKLRQGDSATVASNTLVATTPSVTVATATCPFSFQVKLIYDSVSGKLDVQSVSFVMNGTVTAPTIATMPIAATLTNTANPVVAFTLTATFGTGSAGTPNSINLKDFGIDH
jgi:hypothetical protein